MINFINNNYRVSWNLDSLPSKSKLKNKSNTTIIQQGYPIGYKD